MRPWRYICLIALFAACTTKDTLPKNVLKQEKMQDVFWDYLQLDIYTIDYLSKDSSVTLPDENIRLQQKLFAKHQISREEFYASLHYYSNNNKLMRELVTEMVERKKQVKEEKKEIPVIDSF